jgi:hypothetical protein
VSGKPLRRVGAASFGAMPRGAPSVSGTQSSSLSDILASARLASLQRPQTRFASAGARTAEKRKRKRERQRTAPRTCCTAR